MKPLALAALLAASSGAVEADRALSQAYAGARAAARPAVAAMKTFAAAARSAAPKEASFLLFTNGRFWFLSPNTTPAGWKLTVIAHRGDHVSLRLSNYPSGDEGVAVKFDLDGLDVLVDGVPSKGAHLVLRPRAPERLVEFDAKTAGAWPLTNPNGQILIRQP
jgi:hypothetical protein